MTKLAIISAFAAAAALAPAAASATSAYTYGPGQLAGTGEATDHAALTGGTVIDFSGATVGSATSYSFGPVTFTALNGDLDVTDAYAGSYNTTGRHLDTDYHNTADAIRIDFDGTVSAFGFNFGASDDDWVLAGYDASGALIDSFTLKPTRGSNAGEWFGMAGVGFSWAKLTNVTGSGDYIMFDDFTYAGLSSGESLAGVSQVPLPAAAPLMAAGLGLIGLIRRRKG